MGAVPFRNRARSPEPYHEFQPIVDQPKVNAKASTPGSRNTISNCTGGMDRNQFRADLFASGLIQQLLKNLYRLQVCTQILNDDLAATFRKWYPNFQLVEEPITEMLMAA